MRPAGRYRITRKIADGGMAEIFLGTQHGMEGFERPVVLKRILAALVADPQFRNLMIDEAHIAMSLNHSNIVQVLDLGHARGRYFLVMELVDGWDLNQLLNRASTVSFPLPTELALYIAAEVCRALGYAHSRMRAGQPLGIVHRDVSPHNVLLSEQGEVKLTDFGIAKAMGRREQTGHGVIKGKLAFMSPEQASGFTVDGRSDLFSLGTVLYVLATGKKPFEAPTDLEGILRVRQCKFTPPAEAAPGLAPEFARIIEKAMCAAPGDRYQSAEDMLVDIESVQRSAFRPAGQTELKRWLAELQQLDKVPPISRQQVQPAEGPASGPVDVLDGADLIFDQSEELVVPPEGPVRPTQPTMAATPAYLATLHSSAPAVLPPPKKTSRSAKRVALLGLVALSLAAAALWNWRASNKDSGPVSGRVVVESVPSVPASITATPAVAEPTPEPTADSGVAPTTDDAAPSIRPVAAAEEESAPPNAEEDEESLLQRTEPEAASSIVGEEDGSPQSNPTKPAKAVAVVRPPQSSSVHIVTRPEGAVIRINNRVFGRAPVSLRFRPGITYELTFVKKGYQTTTKRFTVTGRKNQSISASLKKKPEPKKKKSFFKRLFGG